MAANLRAAFVHHVAEPAWVAFIARLEAASPKFAELWSRHEVAEPTDRIKRFRTLDGVDLTTYATSFAVTGAPGARMVVHTPVDAAAAEHLRRRFDHLARTDLA
jgi:hypothetical protein